MLNFLVETKREYTIQLSNLIYFKIYEGLNALYKRSINKTTEEEVLRNFQKFLKKIPKWENNFIINEATRVTADNNELINNLVKAIVKANYIILTYDPKKSLKKMNDNVYQDITSHKLIHQIYIQCARELWDNPFLFYHKYSPIELKRNQREIFSLIKECVFEAIRKLLPIKDILEIYLDETSTPTEIVDKITGTQNVNILNNELVPKLVTQQNPPVENNVLKNVDLKDARVQLEELKKKEEQFKDTIQSILDRNNVVISDSNKTNNNFIKKVQREETVEKTKTDGSNKQSLDSKIKDILEKDLNESEVDISLSYKPENTENYQEVFGNDQLENVKKEQEQNNSIQSINTMEKEKLMKKNKFFNNYLNF